MVLDDFAQALSHELQLFDVAQEGVLEVQALHDDSLLDFVGDVAQHAHRVLEDLSSCSIVDVHDLADEKIIFGGALDESKGDLRF